MLSDWKGWMAAAGGLASIALVAAAVVQPPIGGTDTEGGQFQAFQPFNPWSDDTEEIAEVEPPTEFDGEHRWVQFVGDDVPGVEAEVMISAPGMWPSQNTSTDRGGFLALPEAPAGKLEGGMAGLYEVVARTPGDTGESLGYWDVVRAPPKAAGSTDVKPVEMKPADSLEVQVVDPDGSPVEGAYVRLSRDTIGLVHLRYTTAEDGRAEFRNIPDGTYHLTVDGEGYARNSVTVEHSGQMSADMEVRLDEGGRLRIPYAWRAPPLSEVAQASSSTSGATESEASDASPNAGDDDEELEESDAPAATAEIDVRVADPYGGGVQGGWVEARVDGRLVDETLSSGRQRQQMSVPAGQRVELVATHAGWGDGSKVVAQAKEDTDVIVELGGGLLSEPAGGERMRRPAEIEALLEVPLVSDGSRWRFDRPQPETVAAEAGIQRGDSLLFVREQSGGHLVVAERSGDIVEIEVD